MGHRVKEVLVDTHVFLWSQISPGLISAQAMEIMRNPEIRLWVSIASIWEIAIKAHCGKLELHTQVEDLAALLDDENEEFAPMEITMRNALRAGALPDHHKDPFDRMIVAQAQERTMPIISNDRILDSYGVRRIW
jgi:PIN domain nuclease of toxin-antitoxin system